MEVALKAIEKINHGDIETIPNPQKEITYLTFLIKKEMKAFKKAESYFY